MIGLCDVASSNKLIVNKIHLPKSFFFHTSPTFSGTLPRLNNPHPSGNSLVREKKLIVNKLMGGRCPHCMVFGISVPRPGIEPSAVRAWRPNHWTAREFSNERFTLEACSLLQGILFSRTSETSHWLSSVHIWSTGNTDASLGQKTLGT